MNEPRALTFEMIFPEETFSGMVPLELGPTLDGTVRNTSWRSMDFGQTYTVTITEDPQMGMTIVVIAKRADTITLEESEDVLDQFYPYRLAARSDYSGEPNVTKYAVWPAQRDLELPWRANQLMANK